MRPDQHKQKKSAQYKKKHGLSKESKDNGQHGYKGQRSHTTDKASSDHAGNFKNKPKNKENEDSASKHRHALKSGGATLYDSETSSNCDSGGEETQKQKSYSRRKIVSNWDRYDIPSHEEEKIEQRGEDFTKLLNSAGDAVSQFRFHDEQNWEEGGDIQTGSEFLAVDVSNLAASLECLPVYERLDLDKNLFSKEQLQKLNEISAKNKEIYKPSGTKLLKDVLTTYHSLGEITSEVDTHISYEQIKRNSDKVNDLSKLMDSKMNIISEIQTSDTSVLTEQRASNYNKDNSNSDKSSSKMSENTAKPIERETVDIETQEDDLDFLLSLDKPSDVDAVENIPSMINSDNDRRIDEEKGLVSRPKQITNDKGSAQEKTVNTETDDLEDWLDSVLDD